MKKIGIFGGTFDPIHIGHLMLADAAFEKFGLDKVLLMPTPSPYHRSDKKVTSLKHRTNMLKMAIEGNEHLQYSDFEIRLPGPTYTVNTLSAFKKSYPDCELFLIIGGDSLFSMEEWCRVADIFKMAAIISSKREGENKGASGSCKPKNGNVMSDNDTTVKNAGEEKAEPDMLHEEFLNRIEYLREKYGAEIYDIDMPNIDISSRKIAERIREGKSVRYYVPEAVRKYIIENGLYLTRE